MTVKAYKDDKGVVTVVDDSLPSAAWKARRTEISLANFDGDLDSIDDGTTYAKVNIADVTTNRIDLDKIQDGTTYKKYAATEQTKLSGVETGADVTSTHTAASITSQGALAIKSTIGNAYITDLNVSKLATGTMTADVTISNTFKTAASPNARIEITSSLIAGYSDATTKQFYISSTDGKAYFGAGSCQIDSDGIHMATGGEATHFFTVGQEDYEFGIYNSASDLTVIYRNNGGIRYLNDVEFYYANLKIGNNASDTSTLDARMGTMLIPIKSTTGHPTAVEGLLYANTYDNKISCYIDSAWRDLATW